MTTSPRTFEPLLQSVLDDVEGSFAQLALPSAAVDKWRAELGRLPRGEEHATQLVALAIRFARAGAMDLAEQLTALAMAALRSTGDHEDARARRHVRARELVQPKKAQAAGTLAGVPPPKPRR